MADYGLLGPLLATTEPQACHAAIAGAVRTLDEGAMGAAELARTPYGCVVLWRTEEGPADAVLLAWFSRAQPGRATPCGEGVGLIAGTDDAWVGVIAAALPPPEMEVAMHGLAATAAQHLGRLRRDDEMRRRRERLDSRNAEHTALLRAGADLVWQAGADGILHVTQIFHDRRDLALKLEGRSLADMIAGDTTAQALTARGKSLRARRVSLRGSPDSFALTCTPDPDGGLRGTIADDAPDRLAIDARTLETILDARQREEQLRRETEAMALGLRLLIDDLPFRQKLEQLALHLACAIRCDDVWMVQQRPGETPRLILRQTAPLEEIPQLQRVLSQDALRAVTVLSAQSDDAAFLRTALGMRHGDIMLVALPAQHYLLCRSRHGLSRGDQDVAERISLLLQQALLQGDPNGTAENQTADPDVLREKPARNHAAEIIVFPNAASRA